MKLEIKTLTPLWTGGAAAGKMDRIHETGILGSLRWWYEAIVRGLGGEACDPTTPSCIYEPDKPHNGLCDVCRVFGATGWRRRFRLTLEENDISDASIQHPIKANRTYTDTRGNTRTPTWYFPHPPKTGGFTFHLQSLAQDFPADVIAGLIQFIADWAALGARAQMGFGVVEPVNGRFDIRALYDWLVATTGGRKYPDLPSLQNIFLARIQLNNATDRDTFDLKYDLRQLFAQDRDLRHCIMGTVKDGRIAAKVKVSRAYGDGLMRVWGWIPEEAGVYTGNWNREAVVNAIHNYLRTNYALQIWREVNSSRDTVTPNNNNAQAFLRSLLGLEEEDDAA
ncbi:MAG: type III-B CRISPR module RAMP protein Cmr1 [Ardenticatenaceae bacterium]|nr:type III-B CRISPR module RAMP protein Cmr1 [Ardenticatenaceae bacterium]